MKTPASASTKSYWSLFSIDWETTPKSLRDAVEFMHSLGSFEQFYWGLLLYILQNLIGSTPLGNSGSGLLEIGLQ